MQPCLNENVEKCESYQTELSCAFLVFDQAKATLLAPYPPRQLCHCPNWPSLWQAPEACISLTPTWFIRHCSLPAGACIKYKGVDDISPKPTPAAITLVIIAIEQVHLSRSSQDRIYRIFQSEMCHEREKTYINISHGISRIFLGGAMYFIKTKTKNTHFLQKGEL